MHKHLVRTLGAVAIMMGVASSANAQVFNQPVYLSPKHGMGLSLAFDYGRGMNVDSDELNAYGGRATLVVGRRHHPVESDRGGGTVLLHMVQQLHLTGHLRFQRFWWINWQRLAENLGIRLHDDRSRTIPVCFRATL